MVDYCPSQSQRTGGSARSKGCAPLAQEEWDDMAVEGPSHPDVINAPFLTVAEVAQRMRVSKMTVYRLVHSGELPAVRFGRSFRVQGHAVDQLIADARYEAG
jgi:excisionase family DNA binding protein